MKIIKPMRLGVMTKPIVDSTQSYLAISGLLCFDMLDPETVLTEQSMWDSVTPILGSRGVLDAWTPKCHGEVLIWGEACSPKAIPTESMEVELKVGDLIRKKLTVHGDRYWQPTLTGAKLGKTEPFVRMPISYERAFGGNGYLQNPVGIGYDADKHILAGIPARLPNIEYSNNPILHPSQEPKPAAFMPRACESSSSAAAHTTGVALSGSFASVAASAGVFATKRSPVAARRPNSTPLSGPFLPCSTA